MTDYGERLAIALVQQNFALAIKVMPNAADLLVFGDEILDRYLQVQSEMNKLWAEVSRSETSTSSLVRRSLTRSPFTGGDMPYEALEAWNEWYYSEERANNKTDSSIRPDHASFNAGWSLATEVYRRSRGKIETALCLRSSCTEDHKATADCNRDKLVKKIPSPESDSKPPDPIPALGDQDSLKVAQDGSERPSRGIRDCCRAVLRPEGIACTLRAGHERWKGKWDHVNLIRQWTDGSSTREGPVEWGFNNPLGRKLEDE